MEDNLTLEELNLLVKMSREKEHREHKFMAALKGIDLDENKEDTSFEAVKQRAAATLAGMSEEEYFFDMVGIEVESDEED